MIKRLLAIAFAVLSVAAAVAQPKTKSINFHNWAAIPPMGWNSWDCYGPTVTEAEVKANADYMSQYLKAAGWEYIIVDIRWYVGNDKAHGYNETNPDYVLDSFGRFQPAINRFPSAAGGQGFKPLADYIHSKGLKFGIHIMRGVPVEAVKRQLPIKGTLLTAADIYSKQDQCRWLHDMYTIDPNKKGAQEYYNSIFEVYASWGLDFVKVDDLSSPIYFAEEVEMIRKAIDRTGRKIVLSTSPGETPIDKATHVQNHANMWRTVGDFWDNWSQLKEHFAVFERWNPYRKTGAWPDGDMLPIGHIGIRAERGNDRMSDFTKPEQFTLLTLWSIFKSPLFFGGDLPTNDSFTLALITNKAVLDVQKQSTNNKPLFRNNNQAAWIADANAKGDKYLAVFNIADPVDAQPEKAFWRSGILNRTNTSKMVDVSLDSATKQLYLVVTDGGDNIDWDYADWIAPTIYNGTDSIKLTATKWTKAKAGWGKPKLNGNVAGNKLQVDGIEYKNGIGTHANSVICYNIPQGYHRFKAMVGLDKDGLVQNVGSTVEFMLFTQNPTGPTPPKEANIPVSLAQLGFEKSCVITDLWTGKVLGKFSGEFAPSIQRHGAGLYKLSKQ